MADVEGARGLIMFVLVDDDDIVAALIHGAAKIPIRNVGLDRLRLQLDPLHAGARIRACCGGWGGARCGGTGGKSLRAVPVVLRGACGPALEV